MADARPAVPLVTTDQHHRALGRLTPQLRTPNLDWGEVFDLACDPAGLRNVFHDDERPLLVRDLALDWLRGEMERVPTAQPPVAGA
jgi:hypothetical protein